MLLCTRWLMVHVKVLTIVAFVKVTEVTWRYLRSQTLYHTYLEEFVSVLPPWNTPSWAISIWFNVSRRYFGTIDLILRPNFR